MDDAIVVVENIVRHFHLPQNKGRNWSTIAVEAVNEVGNPTILATFAVIAAVLPMAFVGGLMGPYMRPIPIGSSAAMFWSLAIAFIVTPWASIRILRWGRKYSRLTEGTACVVEGEAPSAHLHSEHPGGFLHPALPPLHGAAARPDAAGATLSWRASSACCSAPWPLVGIGWVKVKMLPFDNKSEFQIILNMPEGSALERTAQAAREIAAAVRTEPEVTDYQIYAGVAVAVQLQRPGAPLLHAPRRERRRHAGQPGAQGRAQGAEPRHRQARPPARRRRSPPNTARASPWPRCRPARPSCRRSWRKSTGRPRKAGTPWPGR